MISNQHISWAFIGLAALIFAYLLLRKKKDDTLPARYVGPEPVSHEVAETRTLSVYGDSISVLLNLFGLHATAVTNYSRAGTNFKEWMLGQVDGLLPIAEQIQRDPSRAILSRYGMNDLLFATPPELFRQAVLQFIIACRENGAVPILSNLTQFTAPFPDAKKNKELLERRYIYDDILRSCAAQFNVHFIDIASVPFFGAGELEDGLHPIKNGAYAGRVQAFIEHKIHVLGILPEVLVEGEISVAAAA
jgi:hypothetical protein